MRQIAPFIPIVGVIITLYYSIVKDEETGMEHFGIVYFSSFFVQAVSWGILFKLILG